MQYKFCVLLCQKNGVDEPHVIDSKVINLLISRLIHWTKQISKTGSNQCIEVMHLSHKQNFLKALNK